MMTCVFPCGVVWCVCVCVSPKPKEKKKKKDLDVGDDDDDDDAYDGYSTALGGVPQAFF